MADEMIQQSVQNSVHASLIGTPRRKFSVKYADFPSIRPISSSRPPCPVAALVKA